jgi:glutamate-ammonia-ligase adenylyltransferase
MALNHLESFLATQGSWEAFQSLVKLDATAVKVLVAVFANSEYLSRVLVSRPVFLQNLLESRKSSGSGACAKFRMELGEALERATDISEKLDAFRRFKSQEEVRIGMADLLSNVRLAVVSRDLSRLAEVCLDAALNLAVQETGRRFNGAGSVSGLAIIGAGKLGGRELTYGSDLDVLFVYSEARAAAPPPGLSTFEYFSKVAEKTIAYLSTLTREGYVFRVDTRLRPRGSKGTLVQSIEAFRDYYATQAETWELQALLRARFVAGDAAAGREFTASLQDQIYRRRDRAALARDIIAMRARMEEEVGKESTTHYNIKQGAGGIVDIEFLVQYLQLLHGKEHRWVRLPGTFNVLRALRKARLLNEETFGVLAQAYLFLRRLESRMRIVSNQATSDLVRDPAKLHLLARRMGYSDEGSMAGRKLLDDYERFSGQVRSVFNRLLRENLQ